MPFDLVPLVAIPVVFGSAVVVTASVIRYKLKTKELEMRGGHVELEPEIDALRDDLNDTRAQVAEIQERLDFAERMLAAGRTSQDQQGQ
jgi:hypothetical protein